MNNFNYNLTNEEKLQLEVNRLRQENQYLKEEVRRLNTQLSGINNRRNPEDINSPIIDYYTMRYNEIHNYILKNRVSFLDDEINKAEEEYNALMEKENQLGEIASKNEIINEQIKTIQQEIEANIEKHTLANQAFLEVANEVTELENNIYDSTINYYTSLIAKFSTNDMEATISYMSFVIDVLHYNMYNEVVKYLTSAKQALKQLDKLNDLEVEVKNINTALEKEKESLEAKIENISFEETEQKLDELAYEIANKKKVKEELIELFDNLKKQNIKAIKDEIKHLQILEYSNQQVALKMDEIVLEYKKDLTNADTASNILLHKEIKLKKLKAELDLIMPYKEQYDEVSGEYNTLQSMHKTTSDHIDEIESYISKAKKVFESNQSFKKTLMDYDEAKVKMDSLKEKIESYKLREKNLIDARRQTLVDPYGKTALLKIDEELKELQSDIAKFTNDFEGVSNFIRSLQETEQDRKLIMIYEECFKCEQALPPLYEKLRNLGSIINDKYVEVNNLRSKCIKYDELVQQIEEVENEIANI